MAPSGLELAMQPRMTSDLAPWSLPPECWDYRHTQAHLIVSFLWGFVHAGCISYSPQCHDQTHKEGSILVQPIMEGEARWPELEAAAHRSGEISAHFLFILSGTSPLERYLPHLVWGFLPQPSLETFSLNSPNVCLPGDSRACLVDSMLALTLSRHLPN